VPSPGFEESMDVSSVPPRNFGAQEEYYMNANTEYCGGDGGSFERGPPTLLEDIEDKS
jgi:hypothetical protein